MRSRWKTRRPRSRCQRSWAFACRRFSTRVQIHFHLFVQSEPGAAKRIKSTQPLSAVLFQLSKSSREIDPPSHRHIDTFRRRRVNLDTESVISTLGLTDPCAALQRRLVEVVLPDRANRQGMTRIVQEAKGSSCANNLLGEPGRTTAARK
jgi:hypothetical protein